MKTTVPKLRRMIRKVIKEAIDPVTGSGVQEAEEAIEEYMETYADIFADDGLHHHLIGPALLSGDKYLFSMYVGQLDSFSEWVDQLAYDGVTVGYEQLRQYLMNNGFFEMVAAIAQERNN